MSNDFLTLPSGNPVGAVTCTQVYMEYDKTPLLAVGQREEDRFFILLVSEARDTLFYLFARVPEDEWQTFSADPLADNSTITLLRSSDEVWVVSYNFVADNGDLIINTGYTRVELENLPADWLPTVKD